jgi:hypothetical protein
VLTLFGDVGISLLPTLLPALSRAVRHRQDIRPVVQMG